MATVILPPPDCLGNGLRHRGGLVLSPPLKSRRNSKPRSSSSSSPNPNFNRDDAICSGRRRGTPTVGDKANRQGDRGRSRVRETSTAKISPKNLVMGQVKILKRGEILSSDGGFDCGGKRLESKREDLDLVLASTDRLQSKGEDLDLDLVLGSTDRLGPDPDLMQKQVSFPEMKVADGIYAGSGAFFASPPPSLVPLPTFLDKNGVATSDLRRLLGLDLD